jgi:hypothetical protein
MTATSRASTRSVVGSGVGGKEIGAVVKDEGLTVRGKIACSRRCRHVGFDARRFDAGKTSFHLVLHGT